LNAAHCLQRRAKPIDFNGKMAKFTVEFQPYNLSRIVNNRAKQHVPDRKSSSEWQVLNIVLLAGGGTSLTICLSWVRQFCAKWNGKSCQSCSNDELKGERSFYEKAQIEGHIGAGYN
jgi:hypothetical protein